MGLEQVQMIVDEGVGVLTLNDPERLNALNQGMLGEIHKVVQEVRTGDGVKVLVITGAGRAFSAGGDIRRMEERFEESPPDARERIRNFHAAVLSLRNLEKPVIASVNGAAVGAGCSLALACDLRIASERARFGLTHVKLGLTPDGGGMYFLPRLVGPSRALELLLTGEIVDARLAEAMGLVNRVVSHDELHEATMALAQRLAKGPSLAMGMIKSTMYRGLGMDLAEELEVEALSVAVCLKSEDHREGVKAFIEGREPSFKGR